MMATIYDPILWVQEVWLLLTRAWRKKTPGRSPGPM